MSVFTYQNTPKVLLLQDIKFKLYVMIQKSKNLKSHNDKKISFLKNVVQHASKNLKKKS